MKQMILKKNQDGGLKSLFILLLLLFFISSSQKVFASQILDFEAEEFISKIISDIASVNEINKEIKFKINNSNEINAFVDIHNTIHINSGLIQYCEDYIALLSVLAHEIGHINLNHVSLRKKNIQKANKFNNLSMLSVLAGSAITQNPELLQSTLITNAALSNQYINFSKEQEIEADLYSLKTLKLLNVNSDSIVNLLITIEKKLLAKGFKKDSQRISTHPNFEDRISLINSYQNKRENNFNTIYNEKFNFIKAKFIGYSDNNDIINKLNEPYKSYAESIKKARDGKLKMSLQTLNKIIKHYKNSFLIETKAEILFSYGYTNEALKFYKKNLEQYPLNSYAQIRIFENTDIKNLQSDELNHIFNINKKLLFKYYNNKNILIKYLKIAEKLKKQEWVNFLKFYLLFDFQNYNTFEKKLIVFKKTNDQDLLKLINKIEKAN